MNKDSKNTILIVDDEVMNIKILLNLLMPDYILYVAKDGNTAIQMALTHMPDLILLDIVMPEMDGYTVLKELRASRETQNIPVIFITSLSSEEDEKKGLALEVADYISKPFVPELVKLRIKNQMKIVRYLKIIENLSETDTLTGLHNRRAFNKQLLHEWGRAIRNHSTLSMLLLDIDHFKAYNDTHGHQQGDVVLRTVANIFKHTLKRSTDFVARWGGEEFIILLPDTTLAKAINIAEVLREEVAHCRLKLDNGQTANITISVGVNEIAPNSGSKIDKFISDTDKAMYLAKSQGRNKVISRDQL
ncbi:MAG: diguanylate cyclase [Turicibacter sp.]|nr:diguanylate cyclase [Turicibacter sp.]